jgi:hypothetical protein
MPRRRKNNNKTLVYVLSMLAVLFIIALFYFHIIKIEITPNKISSNT